MGVPLTRAVVGVELDVVQAGVVGRLDQERQVGAPVAGDHGVGARRLDLGDVGREVAHLRQRVQVFADDLHVGALDLQVFLGVLGHLHAVRVVLVDQVDLLDVRLILHVGGQRLHLHGGVGVQAEVPVAALAVGQVGVDRGVVEVQQFLAGIAGVVLLDRVDDGQRRARAVALQHVAHALVLRRAQRAGGFLRAELVVDADDLELPGAFGRAIVGRLPSGVDDAADFGRARAARAQTRDDDRRTSEQSAAGSSGPMIYLDSSVALAHLLAEDQTQRAGSALGPTTGLEPAT